MKNSKYVISLIFILTITVVISVNTNKSNAYAIEIPDETTTQKYNEFIETTTAEFLTDTTAPIIYPTEEWSTDEWWTETTYIPETTTSIYGGISAIYISDMTLL